ncbi:E3 SUMO-protein ligase NSE2 isoform X1 [Erpetoichthys calabaricus]|uniref:E3 SUMO-protein ligase NSE2 isoform X1 n=1 Tax=Erpetoichthys calabaricus TaxID=27687 RepID=UPI0022340C53|nr:E3 SUMO-protein ligase NSE2 isoform X1 [Erpetoichthys calabaricus]XP_051791559.1 E3 SUMO-protein ligase NSE2 isoform X1 [Erpetoichthys calabaricus]
MYAKNYSYQNTIRTTRAQQTPAAEVERCERRVAGEKPKTISANELTFKRSVEDVNKLEQMVLKSVAASQDLTNFTKAVQQATAQIKNEPPESMSELVQEKYVALQAASKDLLLKDEKFIKFKENLKEARRQAGLIKNNEEDDQEDLDDDIAVTQSQKNFTCPITQVEMVHPVKNKICNHHYEEEAILKIINNRQKQKKTARCPVVGCDNTNIKPSDLIQDLTLKRVIDKQKKHDGHV